MPQKKKAYSIKASLVKKLTLSTGRAFSVVASLSNSNVNLKDFELSSFGCKSCNSEFAALKGSEPFCVICSSDKVTPIKSSTKIENLAKTNKDELAAIECSGCQTHNILSMATATLLDTKLHCVQCGTEIEYSLDEEVDPTELDEDVDQTYDLEDGENNDAEAVEELPSEDVVTDELSENENDVDIENAEVYDEDLPEAKPDTTIDTAIETKPVETPEVTEKEFNVAAGENGGEDTKTNNGDVTNDGVAIPVVEEQKEVPETAEMVKEEFALADVTEGDLELSRIADKIIASKGNVPVAVLLKEKAIAEHASIFHSNAFVNAINHTVKKQGATQALASFGFELTKVKLPIPQVIESRVKKEVTASTEKVEAKLKDLTEDFQQCLQLASVGLNKNYWKGKQNVLKASLIDNLTAANVRNAEKLVTSCFAQHANESSNTLLEIANSLMSKSVEARNELAEAFGEINDIDDDSDYDDSDCEDSDNEFEARLETASYSVKKRKPELISASASVSELVHSTKSKLGKLF